MDFIFAFYAQAYVHLVCHNWSVLRYVKVSPSQCGAEVSCRCASTNLLQCVYRYTMVWAMGCMSAAHLYRMMTDYGGWSLDFTGPLMIIVQKVTLVAYALHDGESTVCQSVPPCTLKAGL